MQIELETAPKSLELLDELFRLQMKVAQMETKDKVRKAQIVSALRAVHSMIVNLTE